MSNATDNFVDHLDIDAPKTCLGKKIMTWKFRVAVKKPGVITRYAEEKVDVKIRVDHKGVMSFAAKAKMIQSGWEDSDINALRQRVESFFLENYWNHQLMLSTRNTDLEGIETALFNGANPYDAESYLYGGGCLHIAASKESIECLDYLIQKGVKVDSVNGQDRTALNDFVRYKSENDSKGIIRYLVGKGADINAQDNCGCSPLHSATTAHNLNTALCLLELNANALLRQNDGKTALDLAREVAYTQDFVDNIEMHTERQMMDSLIVSYDQMSSMEF